MTDSWIAKGKHNPRIVGLPRSWNRAFLRLCQPKGRLETVCRVLYPSPLTSQAQKALPPQPHEAGGLPSYMTVSQTTSAPHPTTSSYSECIQPGDPEDSQRNPAESSACGVTASSATQFRGVTPGGSEAPRKLGSAKQHSPRGGKQESGLSVSGWP